MGKLFAVVLCLSTLVVPASAQRIPNLAKESLQAVPAKALQAKTACVTVRWEGGTLAGIKDVYNEAERFMKKWNRYQLVGDLKDADIGILVVVEPVTREAGAFSRGLHAWSQSDAAVRLPAPDQTVLTGGIFMYDAAAVLASHDPKTDPDPLLFAVADFHGRKPLVTAGKKLRKMIDEAAMKGAQQ